MLITKEQIKRIYALGSGLGIMEHNNKDDCLHELVFSLTNKSSISELTQAEFKTVESSLLSKFKLVNHKTPLKKKQEPKGQPEKKVKSGAMTARQQSLAWRYIYRLMELDTKSTATAGERMCGAIKKILSIDANIKEPFVWVDQKKGSQLLEVLKKYVVSAEKRAVGA